MLVSDVALSCFMLWPGTSVSDVLFVFVDVVLVHLLLKCITEDKTEERSTMKSSCVIRYHW